MLLPNLNLDFQEKKNMSTHSLLTPNLTHSESEITATPQNQLDTTLTHPAIALPVKRKGTAGSTAVDEAKRVATEAMNRVGAMRSMPCGNGYYMCVSDQCPAKSRLKKERDGTYTTTWPAAHKAGCDQVGKQPARMQETARKTVITMAVAKGRKEIQAETGARALSERAFGGRRLDKVIQRARSDIPEQLSSREGLQAYVDAMPHLAAVRHEVMVGFHAWDAHSAVKIELDDALHADDWDANAPIPVVAPGTEVEDGPADLEPIEVSDAEGSEDDDDDNEEEDVEVKTEDVPAVEGKPAEERQKKAKPRGPHSVSVFTCRSAFIRMLQLPKATRHIDGTFDVAPIFSCLINVGFTVEKVYYPVSYILARSPGTKSYESSAHVLSVFAIIEDMARELLGEAGATAWKMFSGEWMRDGGKGYAKAIRLFFPNAKQRMCYFHMMQAVWKRKKEFPRVYTLVRDTLRRLHLCCDQAEYALGLDIMLKQLSKSNDGRTFVRYWNNTQFGLGRADGHWSVSFAGEVTTNNALEGFNGRLATMVFGNGKKRRSQMWCIDRYIVAMSKVLELQEILIEGSDNSTMWTEWRDVQERAAVNKAAKLGMDMRSCMVQTHCVSESHKLLPGGIGLTAAQYASLAGQRTNSLNHWFAWMDVRHVTDHTCTCWMFWDFALCKHVCALRIIDEKEITPIRGEAASQPGAPRKTGRDEQSHLGRRLQELDANAPKRVKVSQ